MGVIVVLACLCLDWALGPFVSPPGGLFDGNEVHLIESRYPHHLIDPVWAGSRVLFWGAAETFARLAVVALGTLGLFLLLRIGISGSTAGLRPKLPALLLPPAAATGVFWLLTIFSHRGDPAQTLRIHLALLASPFMFTLLTVIQFIALSFARKEHQRLMLAYCCITPIFACGYAGVTCFGLVVFPAPPPHTVYFSGPADTAFSAFMIIALPGLFLLTPMAAASWVLMRVKKIPRTVLTQTP
jgi:hypothetical protein